MKKIAGSIDIVKRKYKFSITTFSYKKNINVQ